MAQPLVVGEFMGDGVGKFDRINFVFPQMQPHH